MSNRITEKFLQAVCARINVATGSPLECYVQLFHDPVTGKAIDPHVEGRRFAAQIGNYHIDYAYGGVSLHRMVNDEGGVSDVFGCGYISKRALADRMFAFLAGLEA